MDFITHPGFVIQNFLNENSSKINKVEYALYSYSQRTLNEKLNRKIIKVIPSEIEKHFIKYSMYNLPSEKDFAFQSKVYLSNGKIGHLPQIDFCSKNIDMICNSILETLPKEYSREIYLFNTGRSYHAYLLNIISDDEWYRFLGTLLLFKKGKSIVDERWVGHSLRSGYSALRWSNNSSRYLKMPKLSAKIIKQKFEKCSVLL